MWERLQWIGPGLVRLGLCQMNLSWPCCRDLFTRGLICGQTFDAEYVVNEPAPLSFEVFLAPDCAGGAMVAELGWAGDR